MLNHLAKSAAILIVSLILVACHKPLALDNDLAFKLLTSAYENSGYTISMVTNNPHAHGKESSGWNCDDKKAQINAGVINCKNSGRSGVYLKFTSEGEKLLVGKPWGDDVLRNARVIAVTQRIDGVQNIEMIDEEHAIVSYTWVYDAHTPFSNHQLKQIIKLDVPQSTQSSFVLHGKQWVIEE